MTSFLNVAVQDGQFVPLGHEKVATAIDEVKFEGENGRLVVSDVRVVWYKQEKKKGGGLFGGFAKALAVGVAGSAAAGVARRHGGIVERDLVARGTDIEYVRIVGEQRSGPVLAGSCLPLRLAGDRVLGEPPQILEFRPGGIPDIHPFIKLFQLLRVPVLVVGIEFLPHTRVLLHIDLETVYRLPDGAQRLTQLQFLLPLDHGSGKLKHTSRKVLMKAHSTYRYRH